MIFFGGWVLRFGVLMKWVRFSTLSFTFSIRSSTIERILYDTLLAFTTFLFLRFNHLADSSFTILGGSSGFLFFSFWERLFFSGPGWVWYISFGTLFSSRRSVYLYAFPAFFSLLFAFKVGFWGSGTGRMLGSSIVYAVFCGFLSPVPYFSSG